MAVIFFVKRQLQTHYLKHGFSKPILLQQKALSTVWFSDLSKVSEIVHYRYSPNLKKEINAFSIAEKRVFINIPAHGNSVIQDTFEIQKN